MRLLKTHPILGLANSFLIDSPQPSNLSYMWNFGSLLGACLVIQILTGVFLAMHYTPSVDLAFVSVEHIMRDVNYGWLIRYLHANTASFFFIFVYLHIGRGLYYGSYKSPRILPWSIGVVMLILMMAIAFLGYVLPYGQMSLWGEFTCPKCIIYDYTSIFCITNCIIFGSFIFIVVYNSNNIMVKRLPAISRVGPHNIDILSIIFGSLLGDSHAERRLTGNGTRISFMQEASHKEYLLWIHSLISNLGYTSQNIPKIQTRLGLGGKLRYIFRFHSFTYASINWVHDLWYVNGVKCVPKNIGDYLTPLALAI